MNKLDWTKRACTLFVICAATAITLPAQTFTTLFSFDNTDGAYPEGALVQATDGNLYGTTQLGGANGVGTVFKITPNGTLTTLYSFCSQTNCTDGGTPLAGLIQAIDGNFYGTTFSGGTDAGGTIFNITPGGTLTTLYRFCSQSNCTDGANPGGLVQGTNGTFYGITAYGGASNGGTVFKITPSGTLTTLHSFDGPDGDHVDAALVQATDGNFYGTTQEGGANGDGTVFKITPSGTLTTLYSFCSQTNCTDGANPIKVALVQATDGNFYGTTYSGGANGYGTVFKMTPDGTLTTLHSFDYTDGEYPFAGLVQGTNGTFYGITAYGGANDDGTAFTLSVGLGPFVETQPDHGKVGRVIEILGTNLTGATSVTFNGTAAVFKVISSSLIGATVPVGATTGTVQVVTPSGTLSSNVPFRVRH